MSKPVAKRKELQKDEVGLERLIFFSDAVFAIAITLLALEIRLPDLPEDAPNAAVVAALLAIWPKYLSYALSFITIGIYWSSHHRMFRHVVRYDGRLIQLNLLLLMAVAFIPFPTAVIGEHGGQAGTMLYAATMAAVGLLHLLVWHDATAGGRLLDQPLPAPVFRATRLRILVPPLVFLLSIPIALWYPDIAKYSWILMGLQRFFRDPPTIQ